ncbi:MAG: DNA gyrase subunit A, partial [Lactobacillus iners]|nr:DNA gyrase subunit A [Lactobacillus iners]
RTMGRVASGVRGIKLRANDYVVGSSIVDDHSEVLVISEKGYGKRTLASEYPIKSRGCMGVKTANVTEKNGPLVGVTVVDGSEDLMLITDAGVIIRLEVDGVSQTGRATIGVRLIKLDQGTKVASLTRVKSEDNSEI